MARSSSSSASADLQSLYAQRRKLVMRDARRAAAKERKRVDALVLTDPQDIRYCAGIEEGAFSLITDGQWAMIVTSAMFKDVAGEQAFVDDIVIMQPGQAGDAAAAEALKKRRFRKLGIQSDRVSLSRHRNLIKHFSAKRLVDLRAVVDKPRMVKDAAELRLTKLAVRIAEQAFLDLTAKSAKGLIGRTENDIAAELEYRMRLLGADRQAFGAGGIIVASGPNAASCHHRPADRTCRSGDVLLIDWGAEIGGYRSDITRVLYLRRVPNEMATVHPIVERALKASTRAIRAGVRGKTVDAVARKIIADAGYGDMIHSTGHGVGLDIHEAPGLGRTSETKLPAGTIVTVEPGIYLHGIGGVRLEDDVVVTSDGCDRLTRLPTDLKSAVLA